MVSGASFSPSDSLFSLIHIKLWSLIFPFAVSVDHRWWYPASGSELKQGLFIKLR